MLAKAHKIVPKDLKKKVFFADDGKGRNYFIQVLKDDEKLHEHYFHLKNLCWKKDQPLFLMKINPSDFELD